MDELTTTFAEARFGKEAFNPAFIEQVKALANMPELPENKRKLRDLIEKSVREEQRKRQEAQKLIGYGKKRLTDPNRMGGVGTMALDTLRAFIPGLSISASADEGIKKEAKEPEEKAPGRIFDVLHGLTAATGAGAGVAAQKGLFGGRYGKDVAEKVLGGSGGLESALMGSLPSGHPAMERLKTIIEGGTEDIGMAAQQHTPVINKIMRIFSPTEWGRRFRGLPASPTPEMARKSLITKMVDKGVAKEHAEELIRKILPEKMISTMSAAKAKMSPEMLKRMPGGWKGGLLGAALLSSPFIIYRLLKTRSLRRRGGTAAESAAEKAEKLLSEAGELRKGRQKLLASA